MQENNKYYVPEISEFHVGFEYEELRKDWVKLTYGGFLPETINEYLKKGKLRVKHLDQQDILNLGWKTTGDRRFPFELDGFFLSMFEDDNTYVCIGRLDNKTSYVFSGTIRNKSESFKLMQMLKIQTK